MTGGSQKKCDKFSIGLAYLPSKNYCQKLENWKNWTLCIKYSHTRSLFESKKFMKKSKKRPQKSGQNLLQKWPHFDVYKIFNFFEGEFSGGKKGPLFFINRFYKFLKNFKKFQKIFTFFSINSINWSFFSIGTPKRTPKRTPRPPQLDPKTDPKTDPLNKISDWVRNYRFLEGGFSVIKLRLLVLGR